MRITVCFLKHLGIILLALAAYLVLACLFMALYHQIFGTVGGNL
jgi:hypothetical protein